jgi:serine/threonine protein kinase
MIRHGTEIHLQKGTYHVSTCIGEGAYGVVWAGVCVADNQTVAIKTIQTRNIINGTPYSKNQLEDIRESLQREIRLLKNISPQRARECSILPMLDSGEYEGSPVFVTDICDQPLTTIYKKRQENDTEFPFDGAILLQWTEQIAAALSTLHAISTREDRAVLRDLKFDNILLKANRIYLSDFGTYKLLDHNVTLSLGGTPEWAAPEMLIPRKIENNKPFYELTSRADLYGMGLILFALIVGYPPKAQDEILRQIDGVGRPNAGAEGYFGKIGGLLDFEKERLERETRNLFSLNGSTLLTAEFTGLPHRETLVQGMCSLIEQLLNPVAGQRPPAETVRKWAANLWEVLNPTVENMNMAGIPLSPIQLEDCRTLEVTVTGKGLPRNGDWLHLAIDDKPTAVEFRPTSASTWAFDLPPFAAEGDFKISVHTYVSGCKIDSEKSINVKASAKQLWTLGRYADALVKEPDRRDWLNELEGRTHRGRMPLDEYRSILETVLARHPTNTDINRRYWQLRHRVEAKKADRNRRWKMKKPLLWAILPVAFFAGLFVFADEWSDYFYRVPGSNPIEYGTHKSKYNLRNTPISTVSERKLGYKMYLENDFQMITGKTVTDRATGLMWQKSGSGYLTYADAKQYIKRLNDNRYAGYHDWRLPTIPELASLVEKEEINGVYIAPIFDRQQKWCWCSDLKTPREAWRVNFTSRYVYSLPTHSNGLVRAVRSAK